MAERKQVNRYYPPDFDPAKHKSINKYRNSHPLRERAKKLSQGILVIRFEMPYNIWCDGCGNHIGMGVRYNAEKKKVGNYYTTPIYHFKMKCHLCDNYIEMETDPKNFDYTITSGARRKNQKWDMAENEQVLTEDREAVKKLSRDAMYKLEHGVDDTKKLKKAAPTLSQIAELQAKKKEDYNQNQIMRKKFRDKKKQLLAIEADDKALLAKSSLDIELVPEAEEDKKLASLLRFSTTESYEERRQQKREEIKSREIFAASTVSSPPSADSSTRSPGSKPRASKRLEAHSTLMAKVMKSRTAGIFGAFSSKGTIGSGRGSGSSGNKTRMLIGGTAGLIVSKKRKRSEDDASVPSSQELKRTKRDDGKRNVENGLDPCQNSGKDPDIAERSTSWNAAELIPDSVSGVIDLTCNLDGDSVADSRTRKSAIEPSVSRAPSFTPFSKESKEFEVPPVSDIESITSKSFREVCSDRTTSHELMPNESVHFDASVNSTGVTKDVDTATCIDSARMRSHSHSPESRTVSVSDASVSHATSELPEHRPSPSEAGTEGEESSGSKLEHSSLSLVSCYSSSSGSEDDET